MLTFYPSIWQEYSSSGQILTTIQFGTAEPRPGGGYLSAKAPTLGYRDFKQQWVGCPTSSPDIHAEQTKDGTVAVYVSWNGATEVEAWDIYGGEMSTKLELIKTVPKTGFETEAHIKSVKYVYAAPKLKHGCPCASAEASKSMVVR